MARRSKDKPDPLKRLRTMVLDNQFARMAKPPVSGQIREAVWRRDPAGNLSGNEAETWERRAIEYWALQCRKYGFAVDLEDIENVIFDDVVVSRVRVLLVIAGERIDEKAWRDRNPPGKLIEELGLA